MNYLGGFSRSPLKELLPQQVALSHSRSLLPLTLLCQRHYLRAAALITAITAAARS